ncbi:MAG: hypothetical protein CM1200mP30_17720 [Pseudomonadota bacterium]|nr:MAG: hypothetical protein CM1200mP30_17720 [Pseudomonadota bacterium]
MEAELPITASLLPASFNFDVIGYGCTSGSTVIGESRVTNAIRTVHPEFLLQILLQHVKQH